MLNPFTKPFHRPAQQQYQVKETTTNKPRPLSDEFSNEFTGENNNNNNGYNSNGINSINNNQ